MQESALRQMRNLGRRISVARHRCGLILALCLVAAGTYAKATVVTLPELVQKSQLIVYGSIHTDDPSSSFATAASVPFTISRILKGTSAHGDIILLCKRRSSLSYPDWPDIAAMSGDNILFLRSNGTCFDLAHNYRSLVKVRGGRAMTGKSRASRWTSHWSPSWRKFAV
jgi:hypothetical protein